jgi:DNA polymerase III epsilon subunit-like protein
MTDKREVFISVDIEAAGPVPPDFSMLSIGACCVDALDDDGFYRELNPLNDRFDPDALKVTGFDLDVLKREGMEPGTAMIEFAEWIARIAENSRPVFVGFNAPFDWAFINYYFHHFMGRNPFGIGGVDIKALYMGATGCTWSETRSSQFPIPELQRSEKHNALADARHQALLFLHARGLRAR